MTLPTYLTVDAIRRANLEAAIARAGSQAKLAKKMSKAPAQISQWLNASPDSKTGRPRGISDDICREIESAIGEPEGWMDNTHPAAATNPGQPSSPPTLEQALPMLLDALASIPALRWPAVRETLGQVVGRPDKPAPSGLFLAR